ncbi:FAD/NAD(P)-binding domain-containing protein [Mytilinidion resinicola]|uniref:FAD/NAD(P)-binding domain-containing protein n=1 Tax=Mytilinidion resinicola TaxID=574789 RepID=A0A6A6YIX5_9PEZI|nr:FAD/NAD(P)-binding domain-containing protein [Mytilinidion resinicola]KAF2808498.1 FAD/NAD(P)-binding domain-containing protein [Mytilinidion resinicola]
MPETIHRVNGYAKDAFTYYPVIVVGAGESGIAMGCQLKQQLGFDQFRIFDRQAGIGGTWWINRYPGVACDVPAVFYSFSFAQNPTWTTLYPPGSEIVRYYHDVCEKFGIFDKIELNTDVEECRWLEDEQLWEVKLRHLVHGMGDLGHKDRSKVLNERGESAVYSSTEIVRAKVVVSAVGGLVEPRGWPDDIPGYDTFKGPIFHSARWDDSVDFTDKDVVVVGTGCSAIQFVPKLTKAPFNAKSVTQLMRSPPWVVPKATPPGGDEAYRKWSPTLFTYIPGLQRLMRTLVFLGGEYDFRLFGVSEWSIKERKKLEDKLVQRIKKMAPEQYHEILTPDYGVGCKRRIFDATWYPCLAEPNVDLTTQPLTRVNEHSVTVGPGSTYPPPSKANSKIPTDAREIAADVIILANGFDTTKWLYPLKVVGRDGNDLIDTMDKRGGPQAYQGTAMDGFPNFFLIFGPNTATGHSSVVLASEGMVNYSINFIRKVLNGEASAVEVKHEAEMAFTKEIQNKLKKMVWTTGGCQNWYVNEGWNSTVYPYTQFDFAWRCMFPKYSDWDITLTSKGVTKRRLRQTARILSWILLFTGLYQAKKRRLTPKGIRDFIRNSLVVVLATALRGIQQLLNALQSI